MVFNTKRIHNSFSRNTFKSFICQQENKTAVRSLRAKIVTRSLTTVNELKISFFCSIISLFLYILKQLFTEVEVTSGGNFTEPRSDEVNTHH